MRHSRLRKTGLALLTVSLAFLPSIQAQSKGGFKISTGVTVTVAEMAGATLRQPDGTPPAELYLPGYPRLWVMEPEYKPIRLIRAEVTDPVSGKRQQELIWYMVYRAVRRDYTQYFADTTREELIRNLRDPALEPVNVTDASRPSVVAPHFTLVTNDSGDQKIYPDVVLPEVQQLIARREGLDLMNSLQAIQPVPELAQNPDDQPVLVGVAMWRNVDPRTDFVSVYMTGFSNGYRLGKATDGSKVVERKTIVQSFWRPGDEFDQDEREFRIRDEDKPRWIYRPENWSISWPQTVRTAPEEVLITRPDAPPAEILTKALGDGN